MEELKAFTKNQEQTRAKQESLLLRSYREQVRELLLFELLLFFSLPL